MPDVDISVLTNLNKRVVEVETIIIDGGYTPGGGGGGGGVPYGNDVPLMDGIGAAGTSLRVSHADHVHPHDDTKAPINNPTFTGVVKGITKEMVGLGNVANVAEADKPITPATQAALDAKAPLNNPTFTGTVSGITKDMVGLGNVDNTSDMNKPISTAVQTALNTKANTNENIAALALKADRTELTAGLALKADKTTTEQAIALKADITYVDTELAKKADKLIADTAFFVNATTGADTATGLTADVALRTINAALAKIPKNLSGYACQINIAAGDYDEKVVVTGFHNGVLHLIGGGAANTNVGAIECNNSNYVLLSSFTVKKVVTDLIGENGALVKIVKDSTVAISGALAVDGTGSAANVSGIYVGGQSGLSVHNGIVVSLSNIKGYGIETHEQSIFSTNADVSGTGNTNGFKAMFGSTSTFAAEPTLACTNAANRYTVNEGGRILVGDKTYGEVTRLSDGYTPVSALTPIAANDSIETAISKLDCTKPRFLGATEATAGWAKIYVLTEPAAGVTASNVSTKKVLLSAGCRNGEFHDGLYYIDIRNGVGTNESIKVTCLQSPSTATPVSFGYASAGANTVLYANLPAWSEVFITPLSLRKDEGVDLPLEAFAFVHLEPADMTEIETFVPTVVTKASIGLGNVDNTSDMDKPISTATQVALDLKAPLESPVFTGTPTAPTGTVDDASTQLATNEFVQEAFGETKKPQFCHSREIIGIERAWSAMFVRNGNMLLVSDRSNKVVIKNITTGLIDNNVTRIGASDSSVDGALQWTSMAGSGLADDPVIIVARNSDKVAVSTDETNNYNWDVHTLPFESDWTDAAYGNGAFAVSGSTLNNNFTSSTDGITWSVRSFPADVTGRKVMWDGTRWMAIGRNATTSVFMHTPTIDGTWTVVSLPSVSTANAQLADLAYCRGRYVVTFYNSDEIVTSEDGITWNVVNVPVTDEGALHTTWDKITGVPDGLVDTQYNGVQFIAAASGTHHIMYSKDGITWTLARMSNEEDWSQIGFVSSNCTLLAPNLDYYNTIRFDGKPLDFVSTLRQDVQAQLDYKIESNYVDKALASVAPIYDYAGNASMATHYHKLLRIPSIPFPATAYAFRSVYKINVSSSIASRIDDEFLMDVYLDTRDDNVKILCTYTKRSTGFGRPYVFSADDGGYLEIFLQTSGQSIVKIQPVITHRSAQWDTDGYGSFECFGETSTTAPIGYPNTAESVELAPKAKSGTVYLASSDWVADGANFTQTVTIYGIGANHQIDLMPTPAILEQLQVNGCAGLLPYNNDGNIVVTALTAAPTEGLDVPYIAIPVQV